MRHVLFGLTVLALLGAAYGYFGQGAKAVDPVQAARADVKKLEKAVMAYCIQKGEFPASLDNLVDAGDLATDGLRDPWRHDYQYDATGRKNKGTRPDIWTVTPTREVIGNWGKDTK